MCRIIGDCGEWPTGVYMRSNCTPAVVQSRSMGYEKCRGRKVNVLGMKCLRSLFGVTNGEVRRRARIEIELASRADQRVLR